MASQYFIANAPASGVIGVLSESEIRGRLAAGTLRPTFVCLPADATGDVSSLWRPLGSMFGTSTPADRSFEPLAIAGLVAGRPRLGAWLILFGIVVAGAGVIVRVQARAWAWPAEWIYSGDRANTKWAYNEALYIDLGLATLALGIGLVFAGIWRAIR